MKRIVIGGVGALVGVGLLLQLVPRRVTHPPVVKEPDWDAETRALARRACMDCHSNEVNVPVYGHVAPFSWLVAHHVDEGRAALNLSEMQRPQAEAHEAGEVVLEGEMPPTWYTWLHPEAVLTDAERQTLAAGLDGALGGEGEGSHGDDD